MEEIPQKELRAVSAFFVGRLRAVVNDKGEYILKIEVSSFCIAFTFVLIRSKQKLDISIFS